MKRHRESFVQDVALKCQLIACKLNITPVNTSCPSIARQKIMRGTIEEIGGNLKMKMGTERTQNGTKLYLGNIGTVCSLLTGKLRASTEKANSILVTMIEVQRSLF